ncbi:hypothetical protein [Campylobacter hyointestinalis]|uniref:DUF4868 domain-containing protein n=2 Tax=Campylobacter hyointestinalis TaxID=198 RepID=A0A855NGD6_CAMHY|nr:hypothetical protein [Campylobacter hyointestinalis]PPB56439.1 hypothetical protein CDQ70_08335 [Campylobacter hyointestinalis subsp. hyointestinalis]PPB72818.1 hypothetical protein CDQ78_00110 [Campylobacter hyointestinalis subsp. hyointestinalis]
MKISLFGKTKNNFVKILDENISEFWNQNIIEKAKEIDFTQNLNYKLEEDEVFVIEYKDDDIDNNFIKTTTNTTSRDTITEKDFKNLEVIFYEIDEVIYFQRIFPSFLITSTWLTFDTLDKGQKGVKIDQKTRLKFENRTDIILDKKNNKIYFMVFNNLEKIFPNFSKYYREASEDEFNKFKANNLLKVDLEFKDLGKRQLTKIAQIIDKIGYFQDNIKDYKKYAKDYDITFEINTKDQINEFHALVFENFYKTPHKSCKKNVKF